MEQQGIRHFLFRIVCGFLLGISVVGPGISGGVMAVLLGIYDRLISIAANPFKKVKETIVFLLPMGIGGALSFGVFIFLLKFLFDSYATPTYLLFIALILGSLPAIYKKAVETPVRLGHIAACVVAFLIAASLGLLEQNHFQFALDTQNVGYLAVAGLIGGAASVVPGVSVSIILMLLGVYETLLQKTAAFDVLTMAPVGICFVVGLVLCSKVIKRVFERYGGFGFFAVLGFMAGSVVGIIPEMPRNAGEWAMSAAFFALGFALSMVFERLAAKLRPAEHSG